VSCIWDKRIVKGILVEKPEWKWEFKNLKVGGSLRMELILTFRRRNFLLNFSTPCI
jgi:hypothetical protein